jgi:chromosomal replication initiation ATPase DnaA
MLGAVGGIIEPETAAEAYRVGFRRKLADRLAMIVSGDTVPHSAVVWGEAGCGRTHLLAAACHPVLEAGCRSPVVRVGGGMVVCGSVFPGDADTAFMRLLGDAAALGGGLLLLEDIDLCLSANGVSSSLLCDAIDHRDVRVLATARSPVRLQRLVQDESLARRLAVFHVECPTRKQVEAAVRELAETSGVEVSPAAIEAALQRSRREGGIEPAASLSLLGAAIADVKWGSRTTVHPDDVSAVPQSEWPESYMED